MDLDKYGAWAVAFGLLLVTFREFIMATVRKEPAPKRDETLAELARALDKLSGVLERIEKSQDRALADLALNQRELLRLMIEIRGLSRGDD